MIIALYVGRVQITPDQFGQLLVATKIGFGVFAALSIIGIFFSLSRGTLRTGNQKKEGQ
jgi:hypothetical protein